VDPQLSWINLRNVYIFEQIFLPQRRNILVKLRLSKV